jgi:outer membrane protein assembly factor BamB
MFKNRPSRAGRTPLPGPPTAHVLGAYADLYGFQSAPVIARDGTVYAASFGGVLYAFYPDLSLKWSRRFANRYVTASPALARDGTLYLSAENSDLLAVNPDGTLRWAFDLEGYGGPSASPAVGRGGVIYVGADYLYAVNPDGTERWRYDTGGYVEGPPALGPDGAVYFPSRDRLYALNPDGTLRWQAAGQDSYALGSAPAVGPDGTVYVNTHLGTLHAFRPDGSLAWTYETERGIVMDVPSSPALGLDGTIYFGGAGQYQGRGGYFYALNPDGTLRWRYLAGCDQSAPSVGGDGTVYFGNNGCGDVIALNPNGTLRWSYDAGALSYVRTAPSIGLGQRMYVGLIRFLGAGELLAFGP